MVVVCMYGLVDMYTTLDIFLIRDLHLDILDILLLELDMYENGLLFIQPLSSFFQLSELEHRVVEAETRAEDAEGKVRPNTRCQSPKYENGF